MTRTVDDVIADWTLRHSGRTRYEGQEPRDDELMLAEVMRLRGRLEQPATPALRCACCGKPWRNA
jgi:hypothetical protein